MGGRPLVYDQKTAILTPEEKKIREENLKARENFSTDSMKRLAAYVCLNAVRDYGHYKRKLDILERTGNKSDYQTKNLIIDLTAKIKECEDFFDSDLFMETTGFDDKDEAIRKLSKVGGQYNTLIKLAE